MLQQKARAIFTKLSNKPPGETPAKNKKIWNQKS